MVRRRGPRSAGLERHESLRISRSYLSEVRVRRGERGRDLSPIRRRQKV